MGRLAGLFSPPHRPFSLHAVLLFLVYPVTGPWASALPSLPTAPLPCFPACVSPCPAVVPSASSGHLLPAVWCGCAFALRLSAARGGGDFGEVTAVSPCISQLWCCVEQVCAFAASRQEGTPTLWIGLRVFPFLAPHVVWSLVGTPSTSLGPSPICE